MSGAAKRVSTLALVACVSGLVGISLGEIRNLGSIPLAETVANIWESQIGLLTDAQGKPRDSEGMATSAQFSLATLTTALAVHHDQITADQWARIEPRLVSTLAVASPRGAGPDGGDRSVHPGGAARRAHSPTLRPAGFGGAVPVGGERA